MLHPDHAQRERTTGMTSAGPSPRPSIPSCTGWNTEIEIFLLFINFVFDCFYYLHSRFCFWWRRWNARGIRQDGRYQPANGRITTGWFEILVTFLFGIGFFVLVPALRITLFISFVNAKISKFVSPLVLWTPSFLWHFMVTYQYSVVCDCVLRFPLVAFSVTCMRRKRTAFVQWWRWYFRHRTISAVWYGIFWFQWCRLGCENVCARLMPRMLSQRLFGLNFLLARRVTNDILFENANAGVCRFIYLKPSNWLTVRHFRYENYENFEIFPTRLNSWIRSGGQN